MLTTLLTHELPLSQGVFSSITKFFWGGGGEGRKNNN